MSLAGTAAIIGNFLYAKMLEDGRCDRAMLERSTMLEVRRILIDLPMTQELIIVFNFFPNRRFFFFAFFAFFVFSHFFHFFHFSSFLVSSCTLRWPRYN